MAGLIAAVIMALVAMIRAAAGGLGFWLPMKNIAALFSGVDALIAGGSAAVVGIIVHLIIGAVAGGIFGLLAGNRLNVFTALIAGLVWGVLVWAVNTWLILPWANEVMLNRVMVAPVWWLVYHLVFGGLLLLTPPLVRAFGGRRTERRHTGDERRVADERRVEEQQRSSRST